MLGIGEVTMELCSVTKVHHRFLKLIAILESSIVLEFSGASVIKSFV